MPSAIMSRAWNTIRRTITSKYSRRCASKCSPRPTWTPLRAMPGSAFAIRWRFPANVSADILDASRYRMESSYVRIKQTFTEYGADCFVADAPTLLAAEALRAKIHRDFKYAPGSTNIRTSAIEAFEARRGVCQDFSHIMLACLRSRGLAARYVSGYLRTLPPPGADAAYVGADASHAWVSVFCPPFGWVDLDPTNDVRVSSDHIIIAWGRDFGDVSPLRGVIVGGGRHRLSVRVSVQPE
jgi:transglutaminase-like putative cysteine protease